MDDGKREPDRLNSWKEIAAHLDVSVRTAQRWEKTEKLPAHRHLHGALGSVFAYKSELNVWWNTCPAARASEPGNATAPASIAVLPFVNLNRDESNDIFSDGLTEELINALASIDGLKVVARTSVFHFKGITGDIRAIGARLGVRMILEGSLRCAGDHIRITVQLISVADGYHIWSEHYDRCAHDIFAVQEEIARGIAAALRVRLGRSRIARWDGSDLESYTLYLEGRHYWAKRTPAGLVKAIDCFEHALERDPQMALAWAGLADCYAWMGPFAGMPAGEAARKAKIAALQAIEIDDTLAEAHTSLGFLSAAYEYDWTGAEARFRRALQLNPNCADAHLYYGALALGPTGRLEEALLHQQRARELDPLSPVTAGALGTQAMMTRRFGDAVAYCRQALDLDPAYPWAYRVLGETYLLQGLYEEAEKAFTGVDAPFLVGGFLGYCYARTRRESQARLLLRQLDELRNPMLAYQIAVLHLGLEQYNMALERLHQAFEAHAMGVYWLRVEPIWDPLRSDLRFTHLLQQLHLTE